MIILESQVFKTIPKSPEQSCIFLNNTQTDKVYVGGLSMGGMGTFEILYRKPDMFAAAFAICGGGNPDTVKSFAKEFDFEIYKGGREETLKFGSRFTNKILSQGTYSWFMGILGSSNNIIYPAFYEDKIWHDPTLYEPTGWHCLYYRN